MSSIHLRQRLALVLAGSALTGGCVSGYGPEPAPPRAAVSDAWPYTGAARVTVGREAVVVSGHPIASEVGRDIMRRGGNAIDAAVAVTFALAVVHPEAGNIGGGGFIVFRSDSGRVYSLDYREMAPGQATRDMYVDDSGNVSDRSRTGHLSSGVPGSVAGMAEAHRRFGRLPWRELVSPAVNLALRGFMIDEYRHRSIRSDSARLSQFPGSAAAYLPNGAPPPVGSLFVQNDLARTLETIRDSGAAGFYRGWVADAIVAEMQRGGGLITHADLERYRAEWREPVRITYRDHTIYAMGPASSGGITLAMIFNIMEGWKSLPAFGSPELLHLQAEAMRRAFIDRNHWLGDPAFVQMPVERLVSKEYAATLRHGINRDRATPTGELPVPSEGTHTTHISIVDPSGAAVAMTTTINDSYGSAVTVQGAGFLLNDEMDDFTSAPGRPNMYGLIQGEANAIAPGKRMLSAMTPTIVEDPRGELYMVLGTPGGPTIITQLFQVMSNVIDHRMGLPDAVAAPRLHHQAQPDRIDLERDGFPAGTIAALEALGHQVRARSVTGDVQAIIRIADVWQGVTDPRRGGGGAGY